MAIADLVGWVARSKTQQSIIKTMMALCNILEPKIQAVDTFSPSLLRIVVPFSACLKILDLLRDSFKQVLVRHPLKIYAIAILPDHLHCIWTLPPADADFSTRWR
jgi:hypothetical protein